MKTITYYGQLSLQEWIKLILKKNITLPEYQRSFVWSENDVSRLIYSLNTEQFIPPVIIAQYDDKENIVIDGQQRLTAVLLSYIGYFPITEKWNDNCHEIIEDDSVISSEKNVDTSLFNDSIKWTFKEIIKNQIDDEEIIKNKLLNDNRYKKLKLEYSKKEIKLKKEFFENTFLGFAYIVPNENDSIENIKIKTQEMYTQLFRNINYFGVKLEPEESRRSLYYLNKNYVNYFDGLTENGKEILDNIKVFEDFKSRKINIVRYLSILSQYYCNNIKNEVLKGYSSYKSRESFYADYVSYIVGLEQENRIEKFSKFKFKDIFPNDEWKERYVALREKILEFKQYMKLDKRGCFTSLVDADYWFFGMFYYIVFENCKFDANKNTKLIKTINDKIYEKRADVNYMKNSNRLENLRNRMIDSITIWSEVVCK